MAMFFDKLGKESKDMIGKGFDANKKVFKFSTTGVEGLTFESTTTDSKGVSNESNFKLTDEAKAMDVKYTYKSKGELSFESNYDMQKLGFLDGLKLTLSGNDNCNLKAAMEFTHDKLLALKADLAFSEKDGKIVPTSTMSIALGQDEFCLGVEAAVFKGGFVLGKSLPSFNINYLSKKNLGVSVNGKGLTGDFSKGCINMRGIYYMPDITGALSLDYCLKAKAMTANVGGEFKVDGDTSVKVKVSKVTAIADGKAGFHVGVKKSLRKGCDASLYYACPVDSSVLASIDAHTIGFNLEVKA